MRYLRRVVLVLVFTLSFAPTARAQAPQPIFTTPLPERPLSTNSVLGIADLRVDGSLRPTFQQVDVAQPVWSRGSTAVAAVGGVRQGWDGTPVFIGRVIAGSDLAGGRLQGSLLVEHATSAPARDAADVITTMGWSRRIRNGIGLGVEGIGRDLEGFWNPREADGGARLLVGPSLHVRSAKGDWAASLVAGPVFHSTSGTSHPGFFAWASWTPTIRHRTRE